MNGASKALRRRAVACVALGLMLCPARPALAYNADGHFRIASFAWQTMRLASDEQLRKHVPWTTRPDDALYPDEQGACGIGASHCKSNDDASYRAFLDELGTRRRQLNELAPGVPDVVDVEMRDQGPWKVPEIVGKCNRTPAAHTVDAFDWTIGSTYRGEITVKGDAAAYASCVHASFPWSGIYRVGTGLRGLALPDDGTTLQGRVFGFHAQDPDNFWQDTVFVQSPLYGPVLGLAAKAIDLSVGMLFAAMACLAALTASIFGGDDLDDCVSNGLDAAKGINVEGWLKDVLPGWDASPSADYVGVWHFIRPNAQGRFNDAPGMDYAKAGPGSAGPGVVDEVIRFASSLLWLRLDPDESDGDDRYQISSSEDGQKPTRRRSGAEFRSELMGDTEFSPVDNLAQYGWQLFRDSATQGEWNTEGLAYPLHALGDVSVPQHVIGSTGWGHRPYEEWVEAHFGDLLLESCRDDDPRSSHACGDAFVRLQLEQSRRILQWARFFHDETRGDTGVRRLVTLAAKETLALVGDTAESWAFCDACSTRWQLNDFTPDDLKKVGLDALLQGGGMFGPYDAHPEKARELLELSVGATVALLMKAGDGRCSDLGLSCDTGGSCCTGTCGSGSCCRARGERCAASAECCHGQACNADGVCCENVSGAACSVDGDCCTGRCTGGTCCKSSMGDTCKSDADCCEGSCTGGVCCTKNKGESCNDDASCCTAQGCGAANTCCTARLGAPCGASDVCCEGSCKVDRCCVDVGVTCTSADDCCSKRCEPQGNQLRCAPKLE